MKRWMQDAKWPLIFLVLLSLSGLASGLAGSQAGPTSDLVSPIVYPPETGGIIMNHSHPAHLRLRCQRCHEGTTQSQRASDSLIPQEQSCAPCHSENLREHTSERTFSERCAMCHLEGEDGQVVHSEFPSARLHFSHQTHARSGVGCIDCHSVQSVQTATRHELPSMESCLRCHEAAGVQTREPMHAERRDVESECTTCHLSLPDGRMRTEFREGELSPPRWLLSMDHDRDFIVRHRWLAADNGSVCAECHTERECIQCHDARVRPSSIHRGDFLTTHASDAQRNNPNCTSCHNTQRFCAECHARLGLAPIRAVGVASGFEVHPPGFADAHGVEARRSMTTCTSCHTERDCVTCHGASGIGAGLSPHPPGFAAQCRSALERNARACVTCHGDLSAIRARCQ